jgi:hypothetical protein
MASQISERDWNVFRELRLVALERLCDKILTDAKAEIERRGKSSHEKYLSLYTLLKRGDDDVARGFNDVRRSTALMQIAIIHSMGLFTGEELQRFSPETNKVIVSYSSILNA